MEGSSLREMGVGIASEIGFRTAAEAGLQDCSPHGLCKIAAVRCAEAGASEHGPMELFGWDDPAMKRKCTRRAAQKCLSASAGGKAFEPDGPSAAEFSRPIGKVGKDKSQWGRLTQIKLMFVTHH